MQYAPSACEKHVDYTTFIIMVVAYSSGGFLLCRSSPLASMYGK